MCAQDSMNSSRSRKKRHYYNDGTNAQFAVNGKETLLIEALTSFYKEEGRIDVLTFFLRNKKRRLSLRLLDWLVTNYAKKHGVIISNEETKNFDFLYLAYKNHLRSYSKKFFDAFARRQRVFYRFTDHSVHRILGEEIDSYINRDDGLITTIAQLNAFRFFIKGGVVDYAVKHLDSIEKDMINSHEKKKNDEIVDTCTSSSSDITVPPIVNDETTVDSKCKTLNDDSDENKIQFSSFNSFVFCQLKMTVQFKK